MSIVAAIGAFLNKHYIKLFAGGLGLAFLAMIIREYADKKFWWTSWDILEGVGFAVAAVGFGILVGKSGRGES